MLSPDQERSILPYSFFYIKIITLELLEPDTLQDIDVEWANRWIKWQGKVPISSISITKIPHPIKLDQDYEKRGQQEFIDFKTNNPEAYNGTLSYLEAFDLSEKISITIRPISFGLTIVLDKYRENLSSHLTEIKGAIAIMCLISDRKEEYFLTGRRSKQQKWHYNRWSSVGGGAEFQYFSDGFEGVLFDEIREEIIADIALSEINLVAILGQNGLPWTNFIFHGYVDKIDINQTIKSNHEFIDNVLMWNKKSRLLQLDDTELFGDMKFMKYRNNDYV